MAILPHDLGYSCRTLIVSLRFPTNDNLSVHLNVFYREILSSIPSNLWPSTKRLLYCAIHLPKIHYKLQRGPDKLQKLRGIAILSGLRLRNVD
jgi:hypothetical protein